MQFSMFKPIFHVYFKVFKANLFKQTTISQCDFSSTDSSLKMFIVELINKSISKKYKLDCYLRLMSMFEFLLI